MDKIHFLILIVLTIGKYILWNILFLNLKNFFLIVVYLGTFISIIISLQMSL